jgi:hypothetical protein
MPMPTVIPADLLALKRELRRARLVLSACPCYGTLPWSQAARLTRRVRAPHKARVSRLIRQVRECRHRHGLGPEPRPWTPRPGHRADGIRCMAVTREFPWSAPSRRRLAALKAWRTMRAADPRRRRELAPVRRRAAARAWATRRNAARPQARDSLAQ